LTGKNRAKGDRFEYRCIDDYYEDLGFGYVYKSWGSHGLQDIIAFMPVVTKEYGLLSYVDMVQCKTNKYGFTKTQDDKEDALKLACAATRGGCYSVHMYKNDKLPKHPLVRQYTNLDLIKMMYGV
jgi:hypothetical protein